MPSLGVSVDHWLDIEVFNAGGMSLDEVLARQNFVAHQHAENPVRFGGVFNVDLQQCSGRGVHRSLPELLGAHFAQTLVPLDVCLLPPGFQSS